MHLDFEVNAVRRTLQLFAIFHKSVLAISGTLIAAVIESNFRLVVGWEHDKSKKRFYGR